MRWTGHKERTAPKKSELEINSKVVIVEMNSWHERRQRQKTEHKKREWDGKEDTTQSCTQRPWKDVISRMVRL